MVSAVKKLNNSNSSESLLLQQMQKINSWSLRTLDEEISSKVNILMDGMNIYNNTPLTPEILETLLSDWYSLERTDCERYQNTHWEYVHVLSLLDLEWNTKTYIELKCKSHISKWEHRLHMTSWTNQYEIESMWLVEKTLLQVSPYVYLANKWDYY